MRSLSTTRCRGPAARTLTIVKAALLDVDGTLVASNDEHTQAWVRALAAFGYDVDSAHIRSLIGMGGDKILPRIDAKLKEGSEPADSITAKRQQIFLNDYAPSLQPTPGARALLERLGELHILRVISTSANRKELDAILKAAGLQDAIDAATTADDAGRSKPDPDVVEAALAKANAAPDETFFLGDTPYDVEAAHKAGVAVVAVRCGGWREPDLGGAAAIYDAPMDFLADLESFLGKRFTQ